MDSDGGGGAVFLMTPVATAVPRVAPFGLDSVIVKVSSASFRASVAMAISTVFVVSPAARLMTPVGKALPAKSAAEAELGPLPATV
ncbi:hypothetical protein D3C71_1966580 [compost metagenome]